MNSVTCGVWPTRNALVAVVVDEAGKPEPPTPFALDEEACWDFLSHLANTQGLEHQLVLPAWLARSTPLARLALQRGVPVWLVPRPLLEAVGVLLALGKQPPRRTAAALARLPLAPLLRRELRSLRPVDRRQLSLL